METTTIVFIIAAIIWGVLAIKSSKDREYELMGMYLFASIMNIILVLGL